jgi:uncharacterized protein (DUF58 family)
VLSTEILRQVKRLQLVTGRQVAEVLAGQYLSVFKGRGMEFDEVRPYVPGDDVRTIDWNVTARHGVPYVKRYIEERQLTVVLLVDISASMEFGSRARSKLEAAAELAALVALSANENDDKVGLVLFHGEVEEYIPPRSGQKHALRVIREVLTRGRHHGGDEDLDLGPVAEAEARRGARPREWVRRLWQKLRRERRSDPRRATNIGYALEFCRRVLPRRAVVFLVTDFLDEGYFPVLRNVRRKHDLVCVHIGDPAEATPAPSGLVTLEDPETGARREVDFGAEAVLAETRAIAERRLAGVESELRASGIDLVRIDATRPVVDPLVAFFRMRQRRLRL